MRRSNYLTGVHVVAALLSVVAAVVGGIHSPAIGFPIAVAILLALDAFPLPFISTSIGVLLYKDALQKMYGSVKQGGIKRGIFIKELFTAAVGWLAIGSFLLGMRTVGISNTILFIALVVSCIASEIEVWMVKRFLKT